MKKLIQWILIIITFIQSFWLGLFLVAYMILIEDKYKNLKKQLEASLIEEKEKEKIPQPKIIGMPNQIYPYKECVIEEYQGKFFRIMKPDGKILNKTLFSLEEAQSEIDKVVSLFPKTERERRKIYNIRFVK